MVWLSGDSFFNRWAIQIVIRLLFIIIPLKKTIVIFNNAYLEIIRTGPNSPEGTNAELVL